MSRRYSTVTDEHLSIDPTLLGRPLASPGRRLAALLVDLPISLLVVLPWLTACGFLALAIQAPTLLSLFSDYRQASDEEQDRLREKVNLELVSIIRERRPDLLPSEVHAALEAGDEAAVGTLLDEENWNVELGSQQRSYYDRSTGTTHLHGDVIYGRLAAVFGGLSGLLGYFTLTIWRFRGQTPGKRLLGIRVVRLDGRPLSLWDAFGRAGGYGASLSTFGLGFLEVLWHPNRQAIHDRISGTVVVRGEPGGAVPRPSRAAAGSEGPDQGRDAAEGPSVG